MLGPWGLALVVQGDDDIGRAKGLEAGLVETEMEQDEAITLNTNLVSAPSHWSSK